MGGLGFLLQHPSQKKKKGKIKTKKSISGNKITKGTFFALFPVNGLQPSVLHIANLSYICILVTETPL